VGYDRIGNFSTLSPCHVDCHKCCHLCSVIVALLLSEALSHRMNKKASIRWQDSARRQFQAGLRGDVGLYWWLLGKPVSNCMFAVIKMVLSGKTMYGPVLKTTQLSAHVQNHASPERCRKSFAMIFLCDHDIPLTGSNSGNLTAFRATFSHIFTAHAQKWPFMNFWLKFWHHHSIPWSRFPYRARYFGNTRTFSVDFCIG